MKIKWSIEGGCKVGARFEPLFYHLEIADEDLDGLSAEHKNKVIEDYVQTDFNQQVYPIWEIEK